MVSAWGMFCLNSPTQRCMMGIGLRNERGCRVLGLGVGDCAHISPLQTMHTLAGKDCSRGGAAIVERTIAVCLCIHLSFTRRLDSHNLPSNLLSHSHRYERQLKRYYFHVKPMPERELQVWCMQIGVLQWVCTSANAYTETKRVT